MIEYQQPMCAAYRRSLMGSLILLAILWSAATARGQDATTPSIGSQTMDYPDVDTDSFILDVNMETLMPWLERYHSFGDDFSKQNELAFRLSRRPYGWPIRLSLMMADPRTSPKTRHALIHFASAIYTVPIQSQAWHRSLTCVKEEAQLTAGALKILRSARVLRPDGSDLSWPAEGLLDPQGMPQRIGAVLKEHPELALDVILTLEAYGPLALKEAEVLMPFMLSADPAVAAAAQKAILKMDPNGLCRLFHLDGKSLTKEQIEKVRYYPSLTCDHGDMVQQVYDLRESDGSPQSELSRLRNELHRVTRFREIQDECSPSIFIEQQELAYYFLDQNLPGDWWKVLSTVYPEENGIYSNDDPLLHIASALLTKRNALADLLHVMHEDDPRIAASMLMLLIDMRKYKPGMTDYSDGDMVDPDVIPAELVKVGKRHPHLRVQVAGCLANYESQAAPFVNTIVPLLLGDETRDVQIIRSHITTIDPTLAEKLEITYEYSRDANSDAYWRERQE